MAYNPRTHGDLLPVANFDKPDYTVGAINAVSSAVTVQPQGPKLDFATITKGSGSWTATQVKTIIDTIQTKAVVYIYEYTSGSPDTLAVAYYPTGAWDASNSGELDAAVTAATAACTTATGAMFSGA
jgi:hypothetical protein